MRFGDLKIGQASTQLDWKRVHLEEVAIITLRNVPLGHDTFSLSLVLSDFDRDSLNRLLVNLSNSLIEVTLEI